MQHRTPEMPSPWLSRARALLSRLLRRSPRENRPLVLWAEMKSIDFEGEDESLTERELRLMK